MLDVSVFLNYLPPVSGLKTSSSLQMGLCVFSLLLKKKRQPCAKNSSGNNGSCVALQFIHGVGF